EEEPRLVMRWNGKKIVDISREFLNSNGAPKHISVSPEAPAPFGREIAGSFAESMKALASDLRNCSRRGLAERFDSTIGAGTVLMPFGGKNQMTPAQAMVQKISMEKKHTDDVSFMAWGFNPYITEKSPYHGAYLAVVESVSKLIASGARFEDVYLTFQEYFEKPGKDAKRWGKPFAALLGAFRAQMDLGVGAIGGKDSMSGSFETLDVPPTLVSFAVTTGKTRDVISPEFKRAGNRLYWLRPRQDENGLPEKKSLLALFDRVNALIRAGKIAAAYTPGDGGVADAVMKMAFGNDLGFRFAPEIPMEELFGYSYGSFLLESGEEIPDALCVGEIAGDGKIRRGEEEIALSELLASFEGKLESVYPAYVPSQKGRTETFTYRAKGYPAPLTKAASPRVLIPAFPGTNCEYDSARAMRDAGADPKIMVIRNLSTADIRESVAAFAEELKKAQIVFIPGGFSGGDEPEGSAKFITAFFRNAAVKEGVAELLEKRDGLMCGICNGFQALIKLGLVPYGRIIDTDANCPTLTFNEIARHQ
ncbi:MAG: phosphoribosylformylglycinamidine synthase subunit PurQ, partial [Clostridia bacterium]|nr:phosphoribosylformylglycinamidine synthase subunit PurQ [Clostridia bacterium]